MFENFRKNKRYNILRPVSKESKSILDEARFSIDEDENIENDSKMVKNYLRKPYAKDSMLGLILGIVATLFTFVDYRMVVYLKGSPDIILSSLGLCSILCALVGLAYAGKSFFEKEVRYLFSYMGLAVCGINFVLWIMIIILGYRG